MLPKQDILKSQPQNLWKWPYLQILIPSFFTLFLYLFKTNLPCHPLIATFSSSLISSSSNSLIPILSSYFFSWLIFHFPILTSWVFPVSSFSPLCFLLGSSPCLLPHWLLLCSCAWSSAFPEQDSNYLILTSWTSYILGSSVSFLQQPSSKGFKVLIKSHFLLSVFPEPLKPSSAWNVSN